MDWRSQPTGPACELDCPWRRRVRERGVSKWQSGRNPARGKNIMRCETHAAGKHAIWRGADQNSWLHNNDRYRDKQITPRASMAIRSRTIGTTLGNRPESAMCRPKRRLGCRDRRRGKGMVWMGGPSQGCHSLRFCMREADQITIMSALDLGHLGVNNFTTKTSTDWGRLWQSRGARRVPT